MSDPKILGALVGDVVHDAGARVKYGHFFDALADSFELAGVCDGTLRGADRLWNGLRMFHPNGRQWRERFYKNIPAFHQRSRRVSAAVAAQDEVDVVLQVGVLFRVETELPIVIYTDYTSQLTARKPQSGRSPFTPAQRKEWIGLERQALLEAAHIFTRGEFVRQAMMADYGIGAERITAVGGGVNFASLPTVQPQSHSPPSSPAAQTLPV